MTIHKIVQLDDALAEVERLSTQRNRALGELEHLAGNAIALPVRGRIVTFPATRARVLLDRIEVLTAQTVHAIEEYNRLVDDAPRPASRFKIVEQAIERENAGDEG